MNEMAQAESMHVVMAGKLFQCLEQFNPAIMFVIRLWMAAIFWKSGILKLQDWDTTLLLFTDEHPVPLLSPELAAYLAVTFELLCPVLLVLGLATRLATLPMLAMTAVIQFTYMNHTDHAYWAMLLLILLCNGAGKWSLDYILRRRYVS